MARDTAAEIAAELCVIGAGSGGLSAAAGAARMGVDVVLIEAAEMGGDCLNAGCVPSKALIAAAKRAAEPRRAEAFGLTSARAQADGARVRAHVRDVIAQIAPHDSQERFEGLGVRVIRARARFVAPDAVAADGLRVRARRFVVATGSRPAIPPIPGLAETPRLTNETVFDLAEIPRRLIVIGGGPIGTELSQAFARLGAEVALIDSGRPLSREDPEAAAVVTEALRRDGVSLRLDARAERVEGGEGRVSVRLEGGETLEGSHLLVAVGRRLTLDALDLDAAGVRVRDGRIALDDGLRSVSNKRVYAVGDAAGGLQFTHLAAHHAGVALRRALFRLPAKAAAPLPRVTYAAPELAQVGETEAEARAALGSRLRVLRADYAESDRARAERAIEGFVKVMTDPRGRVRGATIVGAQAGELIQLWTLAMSAGLRVGEVASMIAPYPTLGELNKRAAGRFYEGRLFGNPWVARAAKALVRLG